MPRPSAAPPSAGRRTGPGQVAPGRTVRTPTCKVTRGRTVAAAAVAAALAALLSACSASAPAHSAASAGTTGSPGDYEQHSAGDAPSPADAQSGQAATTGIGELGR